MKTEISINKQTVKLDKLKSLTARRKEITLVYENRKRPVKLQFDSESLMASAFDRIVTQLNKK